MIKHLFNYSIPLYLKHHCFCETYVATEPIYRTYCGVYPLSFDFKVFSFLISLFEVGTNGKEGGIRLYVLLDVF